MSFRARDRWPCRLVGLALGAGLATGAGAETSPYYIGGSLGLTHVVNPFRAPDGTVFPDNVARTDDFITYSLLAGVDQPIGRQRLYGSANLRDNRWQKNSQLNGTGYDLSLGLDWATIERFSGTVKLAANQNLSLSPVEPGNVETTFDRNVRNTETADLTVAYGLRNRLSLVGGAGYRSVSYSEPQFAYLEYTQDYGSFGVSYTEGGALTLGLGPRFTRGTYPTATCHLDAAGQPLPGYDCNGDNADDYSRRDIDFTARWVPNDISTVSTRLSYGKETHDNSSSERDQSGFSGYLAWGWTPTGRLHVDTSVQRDTGQNLYFATLGNGAVTSDPSDYSQVTDALRIAVRYEVSSKTALNTSIRYAKRLLDNTTIPPGGQPITDSGTDRTLLFQLGLTWDPTPNSEVGCTVNTEQRRTNNLNVSAPYSTQAFGCRAQFLLR